MLFSKKYSHFNKFVFRSPIKPYTKFNFDEFSNEFFESLYLASPDLFDSLEKINFKMEEMSNKQMESLYKYLSRSSYRCTPFGSFSGIGYGEMGEEISQIELEEIAKHKTSTRIDMSYLCLLIETLTKDQEIRRKLEYKLNDSLYSFNNDYRYTEYKIEEGKRVYFLSEIEADEAIEYIITNFTNFTSFNLIVDKISEKFELPLIDVVDYIDSLIDSQILTSNLEPNVSGEDMFESLISNLESSKIDDLILNSIRNVKKQLVKIDQLPLGKKLKHYKQIEAILDQLSIKFNRQLLFQSDLFLNSKKSILNDDIISDLNEGISFLNKFIIKNENEELKKFKKDFYRRYENAMVPISIVLDADVGIGVGGLNSFTTDLTPFLKRNFIKVNEVEVKRNFSKNEFFLAHKLSEFKVLNQDYLELSDDDIKDLKEDWDKYPSTFSAFIELLDNESSNSPYIYLNYTGSGSAASLITRFSHLDQQIESLVDDIFNHEKEVLGHNKILAEVVHLPQSRNGNILFRKNQREYEIPFLAKSLKEEKCQIPIADIFVGVPGGDRVVLFSKKLNKEIIPIHTNAYNYSLNPVLMHYFLCLLQSQYNEGQAFNWGSLATAESFLPRVVYKKVILSPAKWIITPDDVKQFKDKVESEEFQSMVETFKKERKIPNKVFLVSGDNKLLIDFHIKISVKILFRSLLKSKCVLNECFEYNNHIVSSKAVGFKNEIIINYYLNT